MAGGEVEAILAEAGASVVVFRAGVAVARLPGRGIGPLLGLLDAGQLQGAVICDKVIGRAAAALCVVGGASRVRAVCRSEGAAAYLAAHGIPSDADRTVPQIANRDGTGICPMEEAVEGRDDPAEMVRAIRLKLDELKKKGSVK